MKKSKFRESMQARKDKLAQSITRICQGTKETQNFMDAMNVVLDAGLNLHTKHPEILNAAANAVASQIDAVRKEGRKEGVSMERARLGKIRFIECEIDGIKRAIKICENPENRFSDASHFLVTQLKLEIEKLEKEIQEKRNGPLT